MSNLVLGFGIVVLFLSTLYYIKILTNEAMAEVASNYEDLIESLESKIQDLYSKREDDEKAFTEALNDIREKLEDVQDEEQVSNMIDREVCREVERYMTEEYSREDFSDRIDTIESRMETIGSAFRCLGNDL